MASTTAAPRAQEANGRSAAPATAALTLAGRAPVDIAATLQAAVEQGRISPKLGRELLIRLVSPKRATVVIDLPKITGPEAYLTACQRVLEAVATGQLAPADAATVLRMAKTTLEAARLVERTRR
jgi:hypothetical protein